jgi:solute carrier family 25 protein 38
MATSPYFSQVRKQSRPESSNHGSVLPTLTSEGNLVAGATARVGVGFLLNPFSVLKARFEVCTESSTLYSFMTD